VVADEPEDLETLFLFEKSDTKNYFFLKHVMSGKYVLPKCGMNNPWNNT
jgi:hypothetical protein